MAAADSRLSNWKQRFQKAPLARRVVTELERRADEICRRTFDLLRKESPEYRNAVDDESTAESKTHYGELTEGCYRDCLQRSLRLRSVRLRP